MIDLKFMSENAEKEGKAMEDEIYNHFMKSKDEIDNEILEINQNKMVLHNGGKFN
jgi:hypothetical protein